MGRRPPSRLTAALLAALAAGGCAGEARGRQGAALASSVPAAWAGAGPRAGDSTSVVWAFRTEDCLSCMGVDYDVRRVQARFGAGGPLVAVHVGSSEQDVIPRAYFRTRRLRVDRAVTVSPRDFRGLYPGVVLPVLYLVQGRRIVWSTASPGGAPRIQLDTLVQRLRDGLPPATGGSRAAETTPG